MIVAALELGGSHVSGARVDLATAEVEDLVRLALDPGGTRAELLEPILAVARTVAYGVTRMGFAAPGPFDYANGVCTIKGVGKLEGLFGVDLRFELSRVFSDADAPAICFLNDAEAFLLGESWVGAARGHARAIGITLGTGLGSAFLVDGHIVREGLGVPPGGNLHVCQFRGAPVEESISGRAIRARFDNATSVEEIARRAGEGDEHASCVLAVLGSDLAAFLAPWCEEFGATCVVVGGSIAHAWSHFRSPLARLLGTDVAVAARVDDAALFGAAHHCSEPRNGMWTPSSNVGRG
jgi:predicted NBD/HSP70 family sugar kinase